MRLPVLCDFTVEKWPDGATYSSYFLYSDVIHLGTNDGLVIVLKSTWNPESKQNGVFLYNKDSCYESSH